jgi:hypothetical protein
MRIAESSGKKEKVEIRKEEGRRIADCGKFGGQKLEARSQRELKIKN